MTDDDTTPRRDPDQHSVAHQSDTDDLAERKRELRRQVRAARAAMAPAEHDAASARIVARLDELHEISQASCVLLYGASPEEVDVTEAARTIRRRGGRTLYPRVAGDDLELVEVTDTTPLEPGFRGILEPVGPAVSPSEVDAVVVPGIAFDRSCARLGQGKGYYDRLLPGIDGAWIAVGFACQLVEAVPTGPHDQRVDAVVTDVAVVRGDRN